MHEEAFGKMEGIDTHYAARRAGPAKTQERDGAGGGIVAISGKKRKSDAMRLEKGTGTRVISSGVRKRMDGDVDEGVEEDGTVLRHAKRPRFEKGGGLCVSIAPLPNPRAGGERSGDGSGEGEMTQEERDKEAKRLLKEREASSAPAGSTPITRTAGFRVLVATAMPLN